MAGTSGKPIVEKLGIKPGFCIFTAGAPAAYDAIDDNWSGLKFVIPKEQRTKRAK